MFVRFYSTLVKKTKLCILTLTWWSQFFDFHEKRKQVHGKYSVHDIFCITIYRSTNCTCKSKFQNDVTQFPQCKCHIKIIVLLSALFLLMGYQRIASIVGLIQIHVASLESSWLSMLHNRVSLLKWHLFILSIQLLSSYWPVYIWWNYFQWDCVTDRYHYHLSSMAITRGTQLFFFFFFFFGRDVRVGSLKWPGALVFRGRYRPRKTSCKMTFKSHRKHVFSRWVYKPYTSFSV